MKEKAGNTIKLVIFTAILGAFAGAVIWVFLKGVALGADLLWNELWQITGIPYPAIAVCALLGLICGVIRKRFGDYPEELPVVMKKIKKDKYYDYKPMAVILVMAFIPLIIGSSVGPEAGLTGIIAALCYWVGDNVSFAKNDTASFSEIGEALTLGQLFHSPLFGILAVEESEEGEGIKAPGMSKGSKLLLYGISTASGFLVIEVLNSLFGEAMEGFPSFEEATVQRADYLMLIVYIITGLVLYHLFELSEKLTGEMGKRIPPVLRETLCGIVIGVAVAFFPMVMFSGEEQMSKLMGSYMLYAWPVLMGIALLKVFMTAFCINFGMKGGHFFPLIYASTCMGYAISFLVFKDPAPHAAFAAASITAALFGAQLKKPFAAALLLLLCFPVRILFWIFLCAVIGAQIAKTAQTAQAARAEKIKNTEADT